MNHEGNVSSMMANQIVEEIYFDPNQRTRKIPITRENESLIAELKETCLFTPWLKWTIIGVVGTRTSYFVLTSHVQRAQAGELIVVDFKAKKVISRSAA